MINKKPLFNFIFWLLGIIIICFIGISNVFADTNINISTWTNVTGRKWSSNNYESSSNIISDTDTIRAYYNVSSPIYTPPNSFDYVDFLYFQHSGNFNPCNGDDYKTTFYLKFSTPSFVNYVSRVRFSYHSNTGLDSCIISSRNSTTGMVNVSCLTHYESDSNALIIWVDFNRNIPDTQNSWLYIQKNFPLSCMTNTQAIIENQNQNTQNIINNNNQNTQNIIDNNTENTQKIIDDTVDDNSISSAFESFNDYLDDNSTITQLITLPITLYTAILNNLNGSCSPFNLGKLYGEDLILPCINISQYLGNSLWTMIDIIISGFAIYAISKKMIKIFNNFSSLREGDVIDD